jgi:polyisoprenoid-binding protein YceI
MKKFLITFALSALSLTGFAAGKTTKAEVTGNLKWIGYGVGKSHAGTLQLKSGQVELAGDELKGGEFVIDMNSLDTADSEKLKGHLKSADFFEVEKHPEAKFKITKVDVVPAAVAGGPTHKLTGDLTIKGKTNSIEVLAVVKKEGKKWMASGDAEIMDRTSFDIVYNSKKFAPLAKLGNKLIEDNIKIQLNVTTK